MIFFLLIYPLLLILLSIGILRNQRVHNTKTNRFSILIACRNEADRLKGLLDSLDKLQYARDDFEVIFVDDASNDATLNILEVYCLTRDNCFVYSLSKKCKEYLGKKAALKLAAEKSQNEILLFTDADCIVPEKWLCSYNHFFSEKVGMVVGYYMEIDATPFKRFQNIISAGINASTSGLKRAFSAAGGNMAVRKEAFLSVGGYEKIKSYISGDDKLLLKLIRKAKWKIKYCFDEPVFTYSQKEKKKVKNQNMRKYGKFSMSSPGYKLLALLIFIYYLILPYNLIFRRGIVYFIIYYLSSVLFYLTILRKHQIWFKFIDLYYILIYPYYLIFYSIRGLFSSWKWK